MVIATKPTYPEPEIIEVEETAGQLHAFRIQREKYDRNWKWFQNQVVELGRSIFGKNVCVSNGEIFVAETAKEALEMAKAAHPEDCGRFVYWFPSHRLPRIYAHSR